MQWPTGWMLATFAAAGLSVIVPWLVARRRRMVALACIVAASAIWWAYETALDQRARPGDPLIRIDLFVLLPLFGCALVSCMLAVIVGTSPERLARKISERFDD